MKIYITIATMYYKSINEQQRNVFRHIIILLLICMKLRNVSYWCFHSTIFLFDIIAIFSIFCGFLLFAFSATAGGCLENNSMNDIHALQLLNRVILKRCFGVEMNEYRNEILICVFSWSEIGIFKLHIYQAAPKKLPHKSIEKLGSTIHNHFSIAHF